MALKESNSEDVHMSSVSASAHYLRTSFGLTDDVLNQIRTEVTAVLRTLVLERKDVLSIKAAVTFTSTLLDDLLDQKQRNGEEPMTVLSEKQTEENPVPTEGHKQCKTGDVIVKTGQTLYSCFLQLYRIIFRIV
ncbi:hypothetical protein AOLI_G00323710 [Acnodon oligacanthus]